MTMRMWTRKMKSKEKRSRDVVPCAVVVFHVSVKG
jgi:hypothetical protein